MMHLLLTTLAFLAYSSNSCAAYCDSASVRVKQVYCQNERSRSSLEDLQTDILKMSKSFTGAEEALFLKDRSDWLEHAAYNCLTDPRPGPFEACSAGSLKTMHEKMKWLKSLPVKISSPVAQSDPPFSKFCANALNDKQSDSHEVILYLEKFFAVKDCSELAKKQYSLFGFGSSAIPGTPEYEAEKKFPEHLKSLAALAYFPYVTQISLGYGTAVKDLSPLRQLTWLREVSVTASPVSSLAPLEGLQLLEEVGVRSTQVSDLSPLFNHSRLVSLDLRHLKIPKAQIVEFKNKHPQAVVDYP